MNLGVYIQCTQIMEGTGGAVVRRSPSGEGRGVGRGVRPPAPGRDLRPLDARRLSHLVEAEWRPPHRRGGTQGGHREGGIECDVNKLPHSRVSNRNL